MNIKYITKKYSRPKCQRSSQLQISSILQETQYKKYYSIDCQTKKSPQSKSITLNKIKKPSNKIFSITNYINRKKNNIKLMNNDSISQSFNQEQFNQQQFINKNKCMVKLNQNLLGKLSNTNLKNQINQKNNLRIKTTLNQYNHKIKHHSFYQSNLVKQYTQIPQIYSQINNIQKKKQYKKRSTLRHNKMRNTYWQNFCQKSVSQLFSTTNQKYLRQMDYLQPWKEQ